MSKESLWLEARSLRIASCLLVAVGVYLPLMKTTTGYAWLTVGTAAWIGYGLAAVVALLSLFAEDMPATLSRKTAWVCAICLAGLAVYGISVSLDALRWFQYQTAGDMVGWQQVNQDQYWALFYELAGLQPGTSVFNDLRTAYQHFGAGVQVGGQLVFWNTINALPIESARRLTDLPGGFYMPYPLGAAFLVLGAASFAAAVAWPQWAQSEWRQWRARTAGHAVAR